MGRAGKSLPSPGTTAEGTKIEPTILSPTGIDLSLLDTDAVRATERLIGKGFEAYLVGGCVRDLLLGRTPKDYDIATEARPPQVKRVFPRNCRIIGRRFKLAHLHFHGNTKILECSTFRRTPQPSDNGGDDVLIVRDNEFGTAEEDALRRDFTVNALFLDPTRDEILDWTNGLQDVRDRVIRTIGDPIVRFREDPVRILRAAKFAGRLGFSVEPETLAAMAETSSDLVRSAPPRVLEEILRLLRSGHSLDSFQLLREVGALKCLLPVLAEFLATARHDQRVDFWRLLEALDHRVQDGHLPANHLASNGVMLGALLVCPVLAKVERNPGRSASSVAEELLGPLSNSLRLPRRDAGCLKRICGVQHRFLQPDDEKRFRTEGFVHGPYFLEALELFELRMQAFGDGQASIAPWRELAEQLDPAADDPHHVGRADGEGDGEAAGRAAGEEPDGEAPDRDDPDRDEPDRDEPAHDAPAAGRRSERDAEAADVDPAEAPARRHGSRAGNPFPRHGETGPRRGETGPAARHQGPGFGDVEQPQPHAGRRRPEAAASDRSPAEFGLADEPQDAAPTNLPDGDATGGEAGEAPGEPGRRRRRRRRRRGQRAEEHADAVAPALDDPSDAPASVRARPVHGDFVHPEGAGGTGTSADLGPTVGDDDELGDAEPEPFEIGPVRPPAATDEADAAAPGAPGADDLDDDTDVDIDTAPLRREPRLDGRSGDAETTARHRADHRHPGDERHPDGEESDAGFVTESDGAANDGPAGDEPGRRRRRRRRRRRGRRDEGAGQDGTPFPPSHEPAPHGEAVAHESQPHDHPEDGPIVRDRGAPSPEVAPSVGSDPAADDRNGDPLGDPDGDPDGGEGAAAGSEGPGDEPGQDGGRRRRRRRRRGRGRRDQEVPQAADPAAQGPAEPQPADGDVAAEGRRPERATTAAKPQSQPQRRPQPPSRQHRNPHRDGQHPRGGQPGGQRPDQGARQGGNERRRERHQGGPRDVDVVPRYRDRRGKVDVIEPPALDLSAFDVELDPKRVPTFGSIVEGKGRPKRRSPRVPEDGVDDYRPPPPPGSDLGPAPPPPPPAPEGPDTFGDW